MWILPKCRSGSTGVDSVSEVWDELRLWLNGWVKEETGLRAQNTHGRIPQRDPGNNPDRERNQEGLGASGGTLRG